MLIIIKIACGESHLARIFTDILTYRDVHDPLLLETLECIRNFIANCNVTQKYMIEGRKSRESSGITLAESLVRMILDSDKSDKIFTSTMQVLKIMAIHGESRMYMIKVNFCHVQVY